ncbi:MAG TPA: phosphatase PAP2 family protein [Thermoanaerobaculia bacterium]|nr:phosphatase PAP2 family protein [Thermoanaerobaculia bacterium]
MQRAVVLTSFLLLANPLLAGDGTRTRKLAHSIATEVRQYGHDFKAMTLAPLRWDAQRWTRFGEGVGAVAVLYAADRPLYDAVQRNRSSFTNDFAKVVTPFGGRRAEYISALMIITGSMTHDFTMRDAGRDSLESEIWAGGIVTPLLKLTFGRARPSQQKGTHSFQPFNSSYQSFPSGHSTNAWAFATAIAGHYDGWVVPTIVYSIASGVSMSRVNDRAHFPSDVLAGALISRTIARSIVARHQRGRLAWRVTPALGGGRAGMLVRAEF